MQILVKPQDQRKTLHFLSLKAVRKQHSFTLSSPRGPGQARRICSTAASATLAFLQRHEISCSTVWFLTPYSCNLILQVAVLRRTKSVNALKTLGR